MAEPRLHVSCFELTVPEGLLTTAIEQAKGTRLFFQSEKRTAVDDSIISNVSDIVVSKDGDSRVTFKVGLETLESRHNKLCCSFKHVWLLSKEDIREHKVNTLAEESAPPNSCHNNQRQGQGNRSVSGTVVNEADKCNSTSSTEGLHHNRGAEPRQNTADVGTRTKEGKRRQMKNLIHRMNANSEDFEITSLDGIGNKRVITKAKKKRSFQHQQRESFVSGYYQGILDNQICCRLCGKVYKDNDVLFSHVTKYHSESHQYLTQLRVLRRVDCPVCDKTLSNPRELKSHMERMHMEDTGLRHRCTICDKEFRLPRLLKNHLRHAHGEEGSFLCHLCPKAFKAQSYLKDHIKCVHVREPRYMCPLCDKGYVSTRRLLRHKKTHDNPEYSCTDCGRGFHELGNLQRHIRHVHKPATIERITCVECGKLYSTKSNLLQHVKSAHNTIARTNTSQHSLVDHSGIENKNGVAVNKINHSDIGLDINCSTHEVFGGVISVEEEADVNRVNNSDINLTTPASLPIAGILFHSNTVEPNHSFDEQSCSIEDKKGDHEFVSIPTQPSTSELLGINSSTDMNIVIHETSDSHIVLLSRNGHGLEENIVKSNEHTSH